MFASQVETRQKTRELFEKYRELLPEVGEAYGVFPEVAYRDGVLSARIKRLMALTGALVHGCEACILHQTDLAIEQGATVEEILETCAVATSLGGTMAAGETTKVVQYLEERGLV